MGIIKEGLKTLISPKRLAAIGIGYSVYKQYKDSGKTAYEFFGKPTIDKLKNLTDKVDAGLENMQKKNMGGMANARKKGMGLKMAEGGSALKPVPSDNTGLSKLPTPVRNKMGYMKKGGMAKKRAKSSSKKSRGTGAAIRGTKFKGVF